MRPGAKIELSCYGRTREVIPKIVKSLSQENVSLAQVIQISEQLGKLARISTILLRKSFFALLKFQNNFAKNYS